MSSLLWGSRSWRTSPLTCARADVQPGADLPGWTGRRGPGSGCLAGEGAFRGAAVELSGAPAVPRNDRTVGAVRFAQRLELFRGGRRDPPGQPEPLAHPDIARGPNTPAPQLHH